MKRIGNMNDNKKKWIMVLDKDSRLPINGGAFRLRSIEKLGEIKVVPL
jgi:hypothetical protein